MFKNFWNDEAGQTMAEYVLIMVGIAIVCIVAFTNVGEAIKTKLAEITGKLSGTVTPEPSPET